MKSLILCSTLFLCPILLHSQFGPVLYLDTVADKTIQQLSIADLNGDGRDDIVAANGQWPQDYLTCYTQQGDGTFRLVALPAADSLRNLEHFAIGDVSHAGSQEMVAAYGFPWQVSLFTGGIEEMEETVVDDSLDLTTQVLISDINHDGMADLVTLQHTEIVLYFAESPGQFDGGHVIHAGTEFYAIDVGYYNQDTLLDVSVASDGFDILLGDGTGQFDLIESPHIGLTFRLQSADLDGDGDMDIATYEALRGIIFYANDGQGHFIFREPILESIDIFDTFLLEDMDCDGDTDAYTSVSQPGWVIWIENDGQGHFPVYHELHFQQGELIRAVALGDFDEDGTPDPVWGNHILGARMNECTPVGVTGVNQAELKWKVSPNPSQGDVILENHTAGRLTYYLFDYSGRLVVPAFEIDGMEQKSLLMTNVGFYVVFVRDEHGNADAQKLVMVP